MVDKVRILNDVSVSKVRSMMSKLDRLFVPVVSDKCDMPDSCLDGDCTAKALWQGR